MRLRVASPSTRVECRDLKGPNLLVDDHYRVKVSGAHCSCIHACQPAHHLQNPGLTNGHVTFERCTA